MKLIYILERNFILPLVICLVLTSVIVFWVNVYVNSSRYNDEEFKQKIKIGKNKSISLVSTLIQEILYDRFQLVFDYLITAKEFLDTYHSNFNEETEQYFKDIEYYKRYLLSVRTLYMRDKDISYGDDKMAWFINQKDDRDLPNLIKSNDEKEKLQLKYLFLLTKIIPVLKAFFNNFDRKEDFSVDSFYLMNRKTEILAIYPIREPKDYKQVYDFPKYNKNPRNCKDKNGKVPDYFYIFCRESFINVEDIYSKNPKRTMFITYPYHVIDKVQEDNTKSAVGVCYLFNFTSQIDQIKGDIYKQTLNDEFLICADANISCSSVDVVSL